MKNQPEYAAACCPTDIARCDTLEFMSNVIGLPILHPGGLRANEEMIRRCEITKETDVLDVACGKGTNACYFAARTGCRVTGIDLDERLIGESRQVARRQGLSEKVRFEVADASRLPFADKQFSAALIQAVLIMVDNPERVLQETRRVIGPNGRIGILELTWKKQPPQGFFREAEGICTYFRNVRTFEGWKQMIYQDGLAEVHSQLRDMACPCTLKELGLLRAFRIFLKRCFQADIRKRMKQMDRFMKENDEFFGYGIYIGEKRAF